MVGSLPATTIRTVAPEVLTINTEKRLELEGVYGSQQAIRRLRQIMKGLVLQHRLTSEELQSQRMNTLQLIFERYTVICFMSNAI
jgi:hypothetical protein